MEGLTSAQLKKNSPTTDFSWDYHVPFLYCGPWRHCLGSPADVFSEMPRCFMLRQPFMQEPMGWLPGIFSDLFLTCGHVCLQAAQMAHSCLSFRSTINGGRLIAMFDYRRVYFRIPYELPGMVRLMPRASIFFCLPMDSLMISPSIFGSECPS